MSKNETRVRGIVRARAEQNPAALVAEIQKAFAAFKEANDKELADLKKGLADVVQTEKVDRINATITDLGKALDETNAQIAQMKLGGGKQVDPAKAEHAKAFDGFFRKGAEAGLRDLEVKAKLTTQSDPDGGYVVPEEMEAGIDRVLGTVSVMRQIATVRQIGAPTYKKLVNQGGASSGWVGEEETRGGTDSPKLSGLEFTIMELYAQPAATQTMLDDASMDVGAWLAGEVQIEFAEKEGAAFVSGNGVKRPKGLLAYSTVANASYEWGKIGYAATGVAAALSDSTKNGADALIDLTYALKNGYRNGASFLMSDATMNVVRKFKYEGTGEYIFAPPTVSAPVGTILGKPVYTDDNMDAIGAGKFPIAFGDFKRAYLILDRVGIRVLRDPYTSKPNVLFYTTKRVGGGVQNFEAVKLLKVAAS